MIPFPTLPYPDPLLLHFTVESAGLPVILTKHGMKNYNKIKDKPSYKCSLRKPSMREKFKKQEKGSETAPAPIVRNPP